jgi:hypothetical protein
MSSLLIPQLSQQESSILSTASSKQLLLLIVKKLLIDNANSTNIDIFKLIITFQQLAFEFEDELSNPAAMPVPSQSSVPSQPITTAVPSSSSSPQSAASNPNMPAPAPAIDPSQHPLSGIFNQNVNPAFI